MLKIAEVMADLLTERGPQSTSTVANHLQGLGLSDAAARKAIQRVRGPIRRLKWPGLPSRQDILYLEDQYGIEPFWDQLYEILLELDSVYGIALAGMKAYGGSVPESHFARVSGAPKRLSGQVGCDCVLDVLRRMGFVDTDSHDDTGDIVRFAVQTRFPVQPYHRLRARLTAESILLTAFQDWLRKNGMVSFDSVRIRERETLPEFGSFRWDLTAPSYVRALTSRTESSVEPGFVVADVLLGNQVSEETSRYFLRKAHSVASRGRLRPSLAFFIAEGFERAALQLGRSNGYLFTTPALLFGKEVGDALRDLIGVLENAAAVAATNPEKVADLFDKLGRIEGAAGNLRGPLFELIVGHCVREVEGNTIDIGAEVTTSQGRAEIDVLRVKGNQEICAYECKGYSATRSVSRAEIDKWLGTSIPRIYEWIQAQPRFHGLRVGFEFWTSGRFDHDARALLEERARATKRYEIRYRDGEDVEEYIEKVRNSRLIDIYREQYRNHPLSQIWAGVSRSV